MGSPPVKIGLISGPNPAYLEALQWHPPAIAVLSHKRKRHWPGPQSKTAMLAILMVFLSVVLIRIVFTDITTPTVSTDLEAAARSNERMLQMAQWSLAAVMRLGQALIGIRWFNTTRDRAEIADLQHGLETSIKDYRARISALDDRISQLDAALWPHKRKAIWNDILNQYVIMPEDSRSHSQMCAIVFRQTDATPKRKHAAVDLSLG